MSLHVPRLVYISWLIRFSSLDTETEPPRAGFHFDLKVQNESLFFDEEDFRCCVFVSGLSEIWRNFVIFGHKGWAYTKENTHEKKKKKKKRKENTYYLNVVRVTKFLGLKAHRKQHATCDHLFKLTFWKEYEKLSKVVDHSLDTKLVFNQVNRNQ